MMATFELDRAGGAEVLKELVADEIAALTQQIAGQAGDDAKIKMYVTDRAAGSVTVPAERQAKDGALTRAAAAAGLEVKPRAHKERLPRRPRSPRTRKRSSKDTSGDTALDTSR